MKSWLILYLWSAYLQLANVNRVTEVQYIMYCRVVQHKLIIMRAELADPSHCAVPFLSRAAASLCWYMIIYIPVLKGIVINPLEPI